MNEWREVMLGDVIELKRGYDLPKRARADGSFPIVSSSGISGSHSEAKVRGPGVVTGRYGTLGQVFYLAEDFWPLNTSLYVRDFKGNNPRFVALLLESMDLAQHDGAAAVPGLNRNQLHTVPVRVPDRFSQDQIASVVESIDDLIENNRRRVEVLEEMARAIYREWFVHFRYPGHEDVPLVESSLGPIPDGWRVGSLRELATEMRQSVKPSTATADLPYLPIDAINPQSLTVWGHRPGTEAASSLRHFGTGDVVFGAMRAYFHKVCVSPFEGVTRSTCFVLRPEPQHYWYAVLTLADASTVAYAAAHSSGSTIPYAKWQGVLSEMPVVLPTASVSAAFAKRIQPPLEMAQKLADQIRPLASIRDLLLPKLVTGQIDVSHLDAFAAS